MIQNTKCKTDNYKNNRQTFSDLGKSFTQKYAYKLNRQYDVVAAPERPRRRLADVQAAPPSLITPDANRNQKFNETTKPSHEANFSAKNKWKSAFTTNK